MLLGKQTVSTAFPGNGPIKTKSMMESATKSPVETDFISSGEVGRITRYSAATYLNIR